MLKEFHKRIAKEKTLKGLLYGLGTGLLAAGISICAFQLAKLTTWPFYLIGGAIGLAVLLLTFLFYFLTHKTDDKEVARRIDQAFHFQEKASTMVAFRDQDSLLIEKQREDAIKNLKEKNPKKLPVHLTLLCLPLPLIGASAFTASFFTTDIVDHLTVVAPDDNFDDETDDIIDSIKDYVGKSQASAAFKEKIYEILEQLRADLKGDTSIPSRQAKVNAAKLLVDEALDEVNSKEEIGAALVQQGGVFATIGQAVLDADVDVMKDAFALLSAEVDKIVSINGLLKTFQGWNTALKQALKSADVPSGDSNYTTFANLLAQFEAIHDNVEDSQVESSMTTKLILTSRDQAKKSIEGAVENLSVDLVLESANDKLAEDVKKLMDQLVDPNSDNGDLGPEGGTDEGGNQKPDGEEGEVGNEGDQEVNTGEGDEGSADGGEGNGDGNKGDGSGTGSGGEEGEGNGQGQGEGASGGSGDTQYGSDDKVYTGEDGQKNYGEVIGDYQGSASEDAKDTGDDDLEGAIGDYLDELYGDSANGKNNG